MLPCHLSVKLFVHSTALLLLALLQLRHHLGVKLLVQVVENLARDLIVYLCRVQARTHIIVGGNLCRTEYHRTRALWQS